MRYIKALIKPAGLACLFLSMATAYAVTSSPGLQEIKAGPDLKQTSPLRFTNILKQTPLAFEPNAGLFNEKVKYLSRGPGFALYLTQSEATLVLRKSHRLDDAGDKIQDDLNTVTMKWLNANTDSPVTALNLLPGKSNYFIGSDVTQWQRDIPHYQQIRYEDIYPGIDLVYYGHSRTLEYDFIVTPGADPNAIRLGFSGIDDARLDESGNLHLEMEGNEIIQHAPIIYQDIDGKRKKIAGTYVINETGAQESNKKQFHISFRLAQYDHHHDLIIDPVVSYASYLGGFTTDIGYGIVVDSAGSFYVAGQTASGDFPKQGPYQPANAGGDDVFVSKFDSTGSLVYSTFLGGTGIDQGRDIALDDSSKNVFITGSTASSNFPTTVGAYEESDPSGTDAFATRLNALGNGLVYSTYLGGSSTDTGRGIAVDGSGNAYVTGETASSNFPLLNPIQASRVGISDAFVTKLDTTGTNIVYSTFLGGADLDAGRDIVVDGSGNAYVTGMTRTAFNIKNPLQPTIGSGADAFAAKINAAGNTLEYSTYLGGSGDENVDAIVGAITVDGSGNAYVIGTTSSTDFPTESPLQSSNAGGKDVFVTKINAAGSARVYSTYLGGSADDEGWGIAVDGSGNAYVAGITASTDFPTQNPFQAAIGGNGKDGFVAKISSTGNALTYSSYVGGSENDEVLDVTVDSSGKAYIAGQTVSANLSAVALSTTTPFQPNIDSGSPTDADVFVARIEVQPGDLSIVKRDLSGSVSIGDNITYLIIVTNDGSDPATNVVMTDPLPGSVSFVAAIPDQGSCSQLSGTVTCNLGTLAAGATVDVTITVTANSGGKIPNTASVTASEMDPDSSNNSDSVQTTVSVTIGSGGGGGGIISPLMLLLIVVSMRLLTKQRVN